VTHADRPLVAVGLRDTDEQSVREAAQSLGVPFAAGTRCEEIGSALEGVNPVAIVIPLGADGALKACEHVRRQARFAPVPIFGVVTELNDLAFTELFVWGGDDLVDVATPQPMVRRLRALRAQPARAAVDADVEQKNRALVAGSDTTWRTVMGRSLFNGGFAVRFAMSVDGLANECLAEGVRVVVVADDLGPNGPFEALADARARGSNAAYVLVAPPKRMATANRAMKELGRAAVADGFAPPENVLFLVNELLAARGVDKRGSPRLLYGTAISFRAAGRDEGEIGFSYNVSAGGLYVRTLAPLEPGQEAWLEMWAPRSERRVRLAGSVAWRRPFGPNGGATVPAGFGVRVEHGLAGDLDRWRAGYDAFAAAFLRP
jgi:ActR/RegA family two-component response regulator